jgi:hypothetical protein
MTPSAETRDPDARRWVDHVLAWSVEQRGVVKTVDASRRAAVLADGTEIWLASGQTLDLFGQGRRVNVVDDERDGKKWVRSVEAAP